MLRLDVGAGGGDAPPARLHDALEVVRGDAAGAEDVSVCEVPVEESDREVSPRNVARSHLLRRQVSYW